MRKEEILEIFERAEKAAFMAEEQRCVDALKQLTQIRFPLKLMASNMGRRLYQLFENHPSKRIRRLSSDVMDAMRCRVYEETSRKRAAANAHLCVDSDPKKKQKREQQGMIMREDGKKAVAPPPVRDDAFPWLVSLPKCNNKLSSSKKQGKQEGTIAPARLDSVPKTNDKSRDYIRENFAKSLCKVNEKVVDGDMRKKVGAFDPYRVAIDLETEKFDTWGSYCNGGKKSKYRSVMFNLRDEENPDLPCKDLHFDHRRQGEPSKKIGNPENQRSRGRAGSRTVRISGNQ